MSMAGVEKELKIFLEKAGVTGPIEFTVPPKPEMGDLAFACFGLAKELKKSPVEMAKEIVNKLQNYGINELQIVAKFEAVGPYVNFWLDGPKVAKEILKMIEKAGKKYGMHEDGKKKKVLVEYGCPNPLKAFHLGHLRNLVSGESVARVLSNAGYKVVRTNYQGDVGRHVACTLWGIDQLPDEFAAAKKLSLPQKVAFLGKAYAYGAQRIEDPMIKPEIIAYNRKVYENDPSIRAVYKMTRKWSLDYFETIYKKLGTKYNAYYFESEVFKNAVSLVKEFERKNVFRPSEGAVIFPGSEHGLHDRVFLNSEGFPTYEAKEVALAAWHFKDYHPSRIIHVVGKEQTEYFKVVFKAIESVVPESAGKEFHLVGGYLQLKGEQKMSSRTGNVITGDALIEQVRAHVDEVIAESEVKKDVRHKAVVKDRIAIAALKYAMLKGGVSDDIAFDMQASVSLTGDSGPYLLYIVARINSILKKQTTSALRLATAGKGSKKTMPATLEQAEKQLVLKLGEYPDITKKAADELDPSLVSKYVFSLAQAFSTFYHACPVLQAEDPAVRAFRLRLVARVRDVMTVGLKLLGIDTVEEM